MKWRITVPATSRRTWSQIYQRRFFDAWGKLLTLSPTPNVPRWGQSIWKQIYSCCPGATLPDQEVPGTPLSYCIVSQFGQLLVLSSSCKYQHLKTEGVLNVHFIEKVEHRTSKWQWQPLGQALNQGQEDSTQPPGRCVPNHHNSEQGDDPQHQRPGCSLFGILYLVNTIYLLHPKNSLQKDREARNTSILHGDMVNFQPLLGVLL